MEGVRGRDWRFTWVGKTFAIYFCYTARKPQDDQVNFELSQEVICVNSILYLIKTFTGFHFLLERLANPNPQSPVSSPNLVFITKPSFYLRELYSVPLRKRIHFWLIFGGVLSAKRKLLSQFRANANNPGSPASVHMLSNYFALHIA